MSNILIRLVKSVYPQSNIWYSINLFYIIFTMVDKLFSENHIEVMRAHMSMFDTAKESSDLILSLK